jgi:hypothetical protein
MANTGKLHSQSIEQIQQDGKKALILNIIFFVVLFAGILVVPVVGLAYSALAISVSFVASMLYIYLT